MTVCFILAGIVVALGLLCLAARMVIKELNRVESETLSEAASFQPLDQSGDAP